MLSGLTKPTEYPKRCRVVVHAQKQQEAYLAEYREGSRRGPMSIWEFPKISGPNIDPDIL